jgi:type IV secretory pathway TraG/TraD family ATPase VirD4
MAAMVYPPEADDRAGAGKIYRQWERSLLAAILFAHAREQGRHASFSKVYEIINVEPDELKFWITSRPDAHEQAVTELGLKQDTFTGVISGLKQNLQVFDNDQLAKSLTWGENNIDIRALLRAGSILYIGIDENKLGLGGGSVLLRIIKMYLDRELLSEAQHQGGSLKIMTTEWWDEFANLGVVPKIAENLALMRGRGVSLVLAIQNWAQVEHIYTRVGWEAAVGNNIAISMFFPRSLGTGDDPVRFERWLGETTAVDESQSSNRSGGILDGRSGAGRNQRLVARHLMSAAEMAVQAEEPL